MVGLMRGLQVVEKPDDPSPPPSFSTFRPPPPAFPSRAAEVGPFGRSPMFPALSSGRPTSADRVQVGTEQPRLRLAHNNCS